MSHHGGSTPPFCAFEIMHRRISSSQPELCMFQPSLGRMFFFSSLGAALEGFAIAVACAGS